MKILLSYYYYRDTDLDDLCAKFATKPLVFADSGAWSAKTIGADIPLSGYSAWLRRWEHLIDTYVSLDVIGDPEASDRNHKTMLDAGLTPIPVFHAGSPWEYLEAYCESSPYIALGNMVASDKAAVRRWLIAAFKRARETGSVFHGFGQTSIEMLRLFPFYSVDSSSWASGQRYGQITMWDKDRRRWARAKVGTREITEQARLIRDHGGDPAEMVLPGFAQSSVFGIEGGREQRAMIVRVNVTAWLKFEAWLREHHGPVEMPGREPGPHLFLADTNYDARDLVDDRLPPLAMPTGPIVYLATAFAMGQLLDGLAQLGALAQGAAI